MQPVSFNVGSFLVPETTLTWSMGYPTELPEVVGALSRLGDKLDLLISHRYPFDKIIDAFGVAGTPQSAKVMVEFGAVA
jgi:threonine dehydrogenase-like Zn-dependent dehydrogenase